jgi:hypothetical protein
MRAPKLWATSSEQGYSEATKSAPVKEGGKIYQASITETPTFVGFSTRDPEWVGDWAVAGALFEDGAIEYKNDYDLAGDIDAAQANRPSTVRFNAVTRSRGHSSHQHAALTLARGAGHGLTFGGGVDLSRARRWGQIAASTSAAFTDPARGDIVTYGDQLTDADAEGRRVGVALGGLADCGDGWELGASWQGARFAWQREETRSQVSSADATPAGEARGDPSFRRERTHDRRPFDDPPDEWRLSAVRRRDAMARMYGELLLTGYARDDELRLHPTLNATMGGSEGLGPAWRIDYELTTDFDPQHGQTLRGFRPSYRASYMDSLRLSSGLTFLRSDYSVSGRAGFEYGRGRDSYGGDGPRDLVRTTQRQWQASIAFANWR